jgi:hypothetical protein
MNNGGDFDDLTEVQQIAYTIGYIGGERQIPNEEEVRLLLEFLGHGSTGTGEVLTPAELTISQITQTVDWGNGNVAETAISWNPDAFQFPNLWPVAVPLPFDFPKQKDNFNKTKKPDPIKPLTDPLLDDNPDPYYSSRTTSVEDSVDIERINDLIDDGELEDYYNTKAAKESREIHIKNSKQALELLAKKNISSGTILDADKEAFIREGLELSNIYDLKNTDSTDILISYQEAIKHIFKSDHQPGSINLDKVNLLYKESGVQIDSFSEFAPYLASYIGDKNLDKKEMVMLLFAFEKAYKVAVN